MPKLKVVLDSLDGLDDGVKTLYVQGNDGKFRLDADIEDVSGLKSSLEKERNEKREAERRARELSEQFKGIDPEKVKLVMSKFENDEEMKLIAEGKFDEVINRRTEKLRQDTERQINEAKTNAEKAAARAQRFSQQVLDNHIRAAASKAGLHQHAIEDALFRGRNMFQLDENGDPVQLGTDGKPVFGKDGKTPFSPNEWLESMKETAPHWFPAGSTGGGSQGSGSAGGGKVMTRSEFDAMPADKRMAAIKDGTQIVD